MNEVSSLAAIVRLCWANLISAYDLSVIEASTNNVLLKASTYAIDIMADRDDVNMIYLDTCEKPVKAYNLFLFLRGVRKDQLTFFAKEPTTTTHAEWLELHVGILGRHMNDAGQDILQGSKTWIRGYPGLPLQPATEVYGLI